MSFLSYRKEETISIPSVSHQTLNFDHFSSALMKKSGEVQLTRIFPQAWTTRTYPPSRQPYRANHWRNDVFQMEDMLVKPGIQEMLKYNDMLVYQQQLKALSESFSNDLSVLLYVLCYILFIYDESILCFLIRCFMQLILSYVMSSSNSSEDMFPGLSRLSTLSRLSGTAQMLTGTVNTNNESSTNNNNENTPTPASRPSSTDHDATPRTADTFDEIENMFARWPTTKKITLIKQIMSILLGLWLIMFAYQTFFCLGDTFIGASYSIMGSLRKSIRESAYTDKYISDPDSWTPEKAYTQGSFLLNMIGEAKPRSKTIKYITIVLLDCTIITFQLIQLLINYVIGFGIVDRITKGDESEDNVNNEGNENNNNNNTNVNDNGTPTQAREYDGRQGRTRILKVNPFKVFKQILRENV